MKMSLRCLAVALLLTTILTPATLLAENNPNKTTPPVVHKPIIPPDGNPWPHVLGNGSSRLRLTME